MKAATRKALTAGGTFCVALGIGFVMQYGDALASRLGVDEPIAGPAERPTTAPVVTVGSTAVIPQGPTPRPTVDTVTLAAIPQEMAVPTFDMPGAAVFPSDEVDVAVATLDAGTASPKGGNGTSVMTDAPTLAVPEVQACSPVMTATAAPMAMVHLTLSDACHRSAPVTIHHQGMMFSALTDADGVLTVDVPALAPDALFVADFKSGIGAAASVMVPEVALVDRAVLQWQGDDGVQIHALEFGAGYADPGHIWADSAGDPALAAEGTRGFLTTLGDPAVSDAMRAEVYTFPGGQSARDGQVVLNVEAEITSRNCGRDVAAQSIQIGPDHPVKAVDLTMTMPGCDAIGEFLVLKNMFADLTLAAK